MLKNILIKTSELLNRDDIIKELNSKIEGKSESIKMDIARLISYYNYTIEKLCREYFEITFSETASSDSYRRISLQNLKYNPLKIIKIIRNQQEVFFSEFSTYVLVPNENTDYEIVYSYIPNQLTKLDDELILPKGVSEKIICYGIASEFLASKNSYTQSEYWNNKFMLEIFKSKTSRDRKLKQRFTI